MRRMLRFLLIGFCTVVALGAAAFAYFLYVPSPEAPRTRRGSSPSASPTAGT
ncbi:MAG: hypothetical protein ABR499_19505 [Gemmatimonadaceae bacterium]